MLAACTLTDEPVTLVNIPLIEDVRTMLAILEDLGASVTLRGHTVTVCARGVNKTRLDAELCRKVRTSILFAGPLVARHGRVTMNPPGGDVIGRRRLDTHFDGLRELGICVGGSGDYRFTRGRFRGTDILLDEASVTATENIVMAAVLAPGKTTVFNAACEPHVQDLCRMLIRMGAQIGGVGTNFLSITGVGELHGVRHCITPDYIEAASYVAAAALTGGALTIQGVEAESMRIISKPFRRLGIVWKVQGEDLILPARQALSIENDYGAAIPKMEDGIWPSFPSDLMSVAIVLATRTKGTMLFFEKMFESRMYFVDRLIEMGARIVQCDPHRVVVSGPTRLRGVPMSSPDIRAGMALVLAALCAEGESVIGNAQSIDRGYENIAGVLRKLGADITRKE
jgi:UDP-N-acetylglucosamine 1-carboxyvinyltransferase